MDYLRIIFRRLKAGTSVPTLRSVALASPVAAAMTTAAGATHHLLAAAAMQTQMTAAVVAADMVMTDSAVAEAAPADWPTPSQTLAQMPATSVEARSAPAVRVPAVLVATVKVLDLLNGADGIGGLSKTGKRHRFRLHGEGSNRGGKRGDCEAFPHLVSFLRRIIPTRFFHLLAA
jgi:hypothetical protein